MKISTSYLPLLLSLAFGVSSCINTNNVVKPDQKPVVNAYLAPGQPISLQLNTVIGYSEDSNADSVSHPIDGQTIQIRVSDGKIFTLKNIGNGEYVSGDNEVVRFGLTYSLNLTYKGLAVSATTTIPTRPTGFSIDHKTISRNQLILGGGPGQGGPFTPGGFNQGDNAPLVLTWNNPNNEYHFVSVFTTEANPEPIIVANGNGIGGRGPGGPRRVNNEPTTASVANIQPQTFQYFGKYSVVLYHLNPDYAALYRSGGTTTQNISTPPTSIVNGLGIFTGVNTDTIKVFVQKI